MTNTTQRPVDAPDATHLVGRIARAADAPADGTVLDGFGGRRVPQHFPALLSASASEYVRLVAEGGTQGPAHAYLSRLRQEAEPWCDPWQLAEAVASRLARKGG